MGRTRGLHAKQRGPRRNQPWPRLYLSLPASALPGSQPPSLQKQEGVNVCCLRHPGFGIWLWWPQKISILPNEATGFPVDTARGPAMCRHLASEFPKRSKVERGPTPWGGRGSNPGTSSCLESLLSCVKNNVVTGRVKNYLLIQYSHRVNTRGGAICAQRS